MKAYKFVAATLAISFSYPAISGDYFSMKPAKNAAKSVAQMQPLIGDWHCKRQVRQQDGSWITPEQISRWEWRYTLNGHAVQDFWYPKAKDLQAAGMGTNLRVYDPAEDRWLMTWSFDKMADFQDFTAKFDNKTLVMNGDYPKRGQTPAHKARITFHNISDKHFDWKYESSALTDGKSWSEVFRLNCDKI